MKGTTRAAIDAAVDEIVAREEASGVPEGFMRKDEAERHHDGRRAGLHALLLAGPPMAGAADAFTTRLVLEGGGREINPLAQPFVGAGDAALYGTKVGLGLSVSALAELAARKGHRRAATIGALLGTVAPAALAASNLVQARRQARGGP